MLLRIEGAGVPGEQSWTWACSVPLHQKKPTVSWVALGRASTAGRSRKVILPQYEIDMHMVGWVSWGITKLIEGLEHVSDEERVRELGPFSSKKRRLQPNFCLQTLTKKVWNRPTHLRFAEWWKTIDISCKKRNSDWVFGILISPRVWSEVCPRQVVEFPFLETFKTGLHKGLSNLILLWNRIFVLRDVWTRWPTEVLPHLIYSRKLWFSHFTKEAKGNSGFELRLNLWAQEQYHVTSTWPIWQKLLFSLYYFSTCLHSNLWLRKQKQESKQIHC